VEARKRFGRPIGTTKPFFMYIDEAHLFAPFALRELLNTMRKANMKVTIATQTINTFPREFAKEISALVRTLVCFKVDLETANMFKTVMPVSIEQLTSMTQGRFAFYSQGNPPHTGLLIAVPIVDRKKDWKELARYSVEKYGEPTSLERYVMPTKSQHLSPQVTPLEATILLLLYNENRDMTKDEIYDFVYKMFPVDKRDVFSKLDDILVNQLHLVERKNMIFNDGADKLAISYVLSGLAYNSFFSQTAIGRRAGSPLHQTTIFLIMNMQQKTFKFCIPDLGDKGEQRPDLLIFEPQRRKASKGITCDPLHWSEKIIAVEVEIDPTKHESQVVENFRKNFELGYDVWFIVFSDKYKQYVVNTMNKNNIAEQFYNIAIISPDAVGRLGNIQNDSISCLTGKELEVFNVLKGDGTAQSVDYKTGLSACDVMKILWKLEQKGVTESGYVGTRNTEFDLERKDIVQVKRQEYFVPVEKGKKLGENSDSHNLETEKKNDTAASSDANAQKLAGFDFSKLSNQGLKDLVLDPECGTFAKTLLENRGNYVYVKNGKVKTRKKSR
ncbi:MAG: hypothetical protein KGI19_10400, partial [Thaumarchaeota archaeon]|nr:hypothetical protein [Nitrososphaerota archaeon]